MTSYPRTSWNCTNGFGIGRVTECSHSKEALWTSHLSSKKNNESTGAYFGYCGHFVWPDRMSHIIIAWNKFKLRTTADHSLQALSHKLSPHWCACLCNFSTLHFCVVNVVQLACVRFEEILCWRSKCSLQPMWAKTRNMWNQKKENVENRWADMTQLLFPNWSNLCRIITLTVMVLLKQTVIRGRTCKMHPYLH